MQKDIKAFFRKQLMDWHDRENFRVYPWVKEKDPYKIWLSEIILQQTRADQGLPYYRRFVNSFPDVKALALADETLVFRHWQGLGYYNRCRNLIYTARKIHFEYQGRFPESYQGLLTLKGVGPYTAAAIASFAFGLPHAVLDGNVFRLLSRFFGIEAPIDSTEGKKQFQDLTRVLLDQNRPGDYNQAIMDFGATVCMPKRPDCARCQLASHCHAHAEGLQEVLPVKSGKVIKKRRYFHYLMLNYKDRYFIRQRLDADIWQHLFELYGIETNTTLQDTDDWLSLQPFLSKCQPSVFRFRQTLSHQIIHTEFHVLDLKAKPKMLTGGQWVSEAELEKFAFPKTILSFLKRMNYI